MGILQLPMPLPAESGIIPATKKMVTTDNLATITTANYLNSKVLQGFEVSPSDILLVEYSWNEQSKSGTFGLFTVSSSGGILTLSEYQSVSGVNATLPTTTGNLAVFSNTSGDISQNAATAVNVGNIQAGNNGNAGHFTSFPAGSNSGSLVLSASSNSGNFATTITNAPMGQATALTIPNPSASAAKMLIAPGALVDGNLMQASGTAGLVADSGTPLSALQAKAGIIAKVTGNVAGTSPINFTEMGVTASSVVIGTLNTATTPVPFRLTPNTNQITLQFASDPGAATVSYVIFLAPQG